MFLPYSLNIQLIVALILIMINECQYVARIALRGENEKRFYLLICSTISEKTKTTKGAFDKQCRLQSTK